MARSSRLLITLLWIGVIMFFALQWSSAQTKTPAPQRTVAPKIWDDKALATWATPVAGVNASPNFYTEEEYYAAPVDNLRTYPVYHPDREPKGYLEWMKKQGARPLVELDKLKSESDWLEAGRRVFDEVDFALSRTDDPRIFKYLQDREAIKRDGVRITKDGVILGYRWVVEKNGEVKIAFGECSACHMRVMQDGSVVRGAQGNANFANEISTVLIENLAKNAEKQGVTFNQGAYNAYGVPWLKDDINLRFKTMSEEEINQADGPPFPGTFTRFNGSPYYTTKSPT